MLTSTLGRWSTVGARIGGSSCVSVLGPWLASQMIRLEQIIAFSASTKLRKIHCFVEGSSLHPFSLARHCVRTVLGHNASSSCMYTAILSSTLHCTSLH